MRRRQKTQSSWCKRNPGHAIAYRIDQRAAQKEPGAKRYVCRAFDAKTPWELAKDQFGRKALISLELWEHFSAAMRKTGSRHTSRFPEKTSPKSGDTEPQADDATGVSPTGPMLGTSGSWPGSTTTLVDCIPD